MGNKKTPSNNSKIPKSRIQNETLYRHNKRRYTSSSFGRHLKTVPGSKWGMTVLLDKICR